MTSNRPPLSAVFCCLGILLTNYAHGQQTYPNRTVKLVVPYPPANVPDAIARSLAKRLSEELGQSFVIDNRPGAAGTIAAEYVARSAPDGYTLLVADPGQMIISPLLMPKLTYQPKDFSPVVVIGAGAFVLAVNSSLNVSNVREFLALARSKPGQINYGSPGVGSIHHLAMEQLQLQTGIKLAHIPYKGGGQTLPALFANEVSAVISGIGTPALAGAAKAGTIKLLAMADSKPSVFAPGVPILGEFGIQGMDFGGDSSIYAPAATPGSVVNKIAIEVIKAIEHPDVLKGLRSAGIVPSGLSGESFSRRFADQYDQYASVIRGAGVKLEQ